MPEHRKAVSKTIRFEVFKRDCFKCQYCGATAPDVLLVIDHIKPVAGGGSNEIANLITACGPCNAGKRDRPLDDRAAVQKQRAQLEELQERREQLELMMQWLEGLRNVRDETIERVCGYWHQLAPGWALNDNGRRKVRKWLRSYRLEEIIRAMDTAADQYLQLTEEGTVTNESWGIAFSKIPGICRVERASADEPDIKELYYIRGILRNRILGYFDEARAIEWLRAARSWDVSLAQLTSMGKRVNSWSQFGSAIEDMIAERKRILGEQ